MLSILSIARSLSSHEGGSYGLYYTDHYSRFPRCFKTNKKGFKVHIRTQFLTPSIRYTVNLVLCKGNSTKKQKYVALRYKLEGETETAIVYLATTTKDNSSFIAELYQFTSSGRTFDLAIVIEDHKEDLNVEGVFFQPLEKVEHEQVLEDEDVSNDSLHWTMTEDLNTKNFKWWHDDENQEGYSIDKNGKKCLMLSARGVITSDKMSFKPLPESRFGEVAVITDCNFNIVKEIKSDVLSPETTYACYLVYKLTEDQPVLQIMGTSSYMYLVSPPDTPIIGQKLVQNTHNQPLNRSKLNYVPRQRSNAWMEVKLPQYQTPSSTETINIGISLWAPHYNDICWLIIESIELRPIIHLV